MRLSIIATTLSLGLVWGLSMFLVAFANMNCDITPPYGTDFLTVMSSIYPGYEVLPTWRSALIATGYGVVDGAIAGLAFSILYNLIARCCGACCGCPTCCQKNQTPST